MAKKFTFRLQTVLDLRSRELEARRAELGKITADWQAEVERTTQLEHALFSAESPDRGATNARTIEALWHHRRALRNDLQEQKHKEEALKEKMVQQQNLVVEAMSRCKAVEKLREKHLESYKERQNAEEQKNLDEIAQRPGRFQ